MLPFGFALAALIGVSLGLLGGGGSILTVPVLVYVLGFGAKPAIAMSLPIVGITSLAGTLLHWRLGNVRLRTAIPFALLAMTGAYAGARLAVLMSGATQLVLLAVVMLAAAASMLRGRRAGTSDSATAESPSRLVLLVPAAIAVGLLTGVVGIGGGFLVVPALVLLARVPMRQAVGTSLFVIALNSVAGFAGYLGTVPIDWAFLAGFTTVAIAGAFAGTALVRVVPAATLKRGFGVFLIAVGAFVLYMNRGALAGATSSATGARTSRLAAAR